jgi:hypothetical protein
MMVVSEMCVCSKLDVYIFIDNKLISGKMLQLLHIFIKKNERFALNHLKLIEKISRKINLLNFIQARIIDTLYYNKG